MEVFVAFATLYTLGVWRHCFEALARKRRLVLISFIVLLSWFSGVTMAGRVHSVTNVCPTLDACMGLVISHGTATVRRTGGDCCVIKVRIIAS